MAMHFFDHQDRARRSSGRLALLFFLGYIGTCGSLWFILALVFAFSAESRGELGPALVDPRVIGWTWGPMTLIVALTSLVKHSELSGGGAKVAALFGGIEVDPATSEPGERQLLNVVEEMSIASGCPMPRVFVIPDDGINAFAAGDTPNDAAIGITSKALESFDRDELQGVIAHEFSHIFHGDMRMNKRITAAIAGIMAIGVVGWIMTRYIGPALASSGRKKEGAGAGLAIILAGLALMLIGCVGTFFGQVIQAAISRQREYLADASAVQYTRNPRGIANALRRIGGWRKTVVANPKVAACSHYFFCAAVDSVFNTHPPLEERIRRIEALPITEAIGDGGAATTSMAQRVAAAGQAGSVRTAPKSPIPMPVPMPVPMPGGLPVPVPIPAVGAVGSPLSAALRDVGRISPAGLSRAASMLAAIPEAVGKDIRTPSGAKAALCLLLGAEQSDFSSLAGSDTVMEQALRTMHGHISTSSRRERLLLLDLAIPALRRLSLDAYKPFRKSLAALVRRDRRVTLAEWTLLNALRFQVEEPLAMATDVAGLRSRRATATLLSLRGAVVEYLGMLAFSGSDPDGSAHALAAGLKVLTIGGGGLPTSDQVSLDALAKNVDRLATLRDRDRDQLLRAAVAVVQNDSHVSDDEGDLVRVLCDALGAPLPPFDTQPAAA